MIILVYPRTGIEVGGAIAPPFGVMFAASILNKENYEIKIIDQRVDKKWKSNLDRELQKNPVCVGFSTMTGAQIGFALDIAKYVREKTDAPLIWGGSHPTILPQQTLENKYVDIVVRAEGEQSLYEIVKALEKDKSLNDIKGISYKEKHKIIHNPDRSPMNMEEVPDTPWELINAEDYIFDSLYLRNSPRTLDIGETSRGCPNRCIFCCNSAIKRHFWRPMSAKRATEKIRYAVEKFKLDGIWIRDDNFYVDMKRVIDICKNISDLDIKWYTAGTCISTFNRIDDKSMKILKRSGCDCLKFGGESGNDRILKMIRKNQTREDIIKSNLKCKKYDIISAYAFMIGFPTETYEEMLDTVSVIKRIKHDYPEAIIDAVNMVTPHYGTELYKIIKEEYSDLYSFIEPKKLEDWISFSFIGENKQVWFDEKMRKRIQNISDTSVYMENVSRLLDSVENSAERLLLKTGMYLPEKYFQFKWNHNLFGYDPTIKVMRLIRKLWLNY